MSRRNHSTLRWLQGRETGIRNRVGDQDHLNHMLYKSVCIVDYLDTCVKPEPSQMPHGGIFNFDFSTDGAVLVAACEKKSFLVFDPNNHKLISTRARAHLDCVNCVRFLDTRSFVTCSDDTTVVLWDLRFLKNKVRTFEGHSSWVKNIEYASSLGLLITSGFDGSVYSWNINNYSKDEESKRLFHTEGLMRCKLTPDESKLVLSTSRGYLVIIHALDLPNLNVNMDNFKADGFSGQQLQAVINNFHYLFKRPKNRLEIVNEFPKDNEAENIASLQVHPQGWCVVSRNTSRDDVTEWTCVHDIHSQPVLKSQEEKEQNAAQSPSGVSPPAPDTSARTNPPVPPRSPWNARRRRYRRYLNAAAISALSRRAYSQEQQQVQIVPQVNAEVPAVVTSASAVDADESENDEDGSSDSDTNTSSNSSDDSAPSVGTSNTTSNLYQYFLMAQWNDIGMALRRAWSLDRPGSDVDMPNDSLESDHEDGHVHVEQRRRFRRRLAINSRRVTQSLFRTICRRRNIYQSQPRLIYCQQEPNVGRGFIKEQCFSSDGRLIVSPFSNGVRLLAFDERCRELCDCQPSVAKNPRRLYEVKALQMHTSHVLTTRFSPTHPLFVSGSLDGSVAFMSPCL